MNAIRAIKPNWLILLLFFRPFLLLEELAIACLGATPCFAFRVGERMNSPRTLAFMPDAPEITLPQL